MSISSCVAPLLDLPPALLEYNQTFVSGTRTRLFLNSGEQQKHRQRWEHVGCRMQTPVWHPSPTLYTVMFLHVASISKFGLFNKCTGYFGKHCSVNKIWRLIEAFEVCLVATDWHLWLTVGSPAALRLLNSNRVRHVELLFKDITYNVCG